MSRLQTTILVSLIVGLLTGCGSSSVSPLSASKSRQLTDARRQIENLVKTDALGDHVLTGTRTALPLIKSFLRSRDPEVGKKIIKLVPSAATIDPNTGESECCDPTMLGNAIDSVTEAERESAKGDEDYEVPVSTIEKALAGIDPAAQIPSEHTDVAGYLSKLAGMLRESKPALAERVSTATK